MAGSRGMDRRGKLRGGAASSKERHHGHGRRCGVCHYREGHKSLRKMKGRRKHPFRPERHL